MDVNSRDNLSTFRTESELVEFHLMISVGLLVIGFCDFKLDRHGFH